MKLYLFPLLVTLALPVFHKHPQRAATTTSIVCGDTPDLNKKIIAFVNSQMNKKVGRGECWDLAAEALNTNGAAWDKHFKYGKKVDPKKDCIYPGDIVQFTDVVVEYTKGTAKYKERMAQHTAIVYEVKGEGDYVLADQNTSIHGRKVGLSPMNLKNITGGKCEIYQPVTN